METFLARMVMPRSRSSSLLSIINSPAASLSRNRCPANSILSTRVVLPWSTWAIIATFLIFCILKHNLFHRSNRPSGHSTMTGRGLAAAKIRKSRQAARCGMRACARRASTGEDEFPKNSGRWKSGCSVCTGDQVRKWRDSVPSAHLQKLPNSLSGTSPTA